MLCALIALLYAVASGAARRYMGAALIVLGILLFGITTVVAFSGSNVGLATLICGVPASVCLGWIGCSVHRRGPPPTPADVVLAALVAPMPSSDEIRRDDVFGPWQFYVDAVTSTIFLDLQRDGRYVEQIVNNGGGTFQCPGGTWTLDGPYLELTGYYSATARSILGTVRWFFGDWQNERVLFVRDDLQSDAHLLAQRLTRSQLRPARR